MVIDRINGVAYVALSERAHKGLAEQWAADMGYRVTFPIFPNNIALMAASILLLPIGQAAVHSPIRCRWKPYTVLMLLLKHAGNRLA